MGDCRDPICGMSGTIECHGHSAWRWWQDRGLWALLLVAVVLGVGELWAPARPAAHSLLGYLKSAGWAVGLGLLIGGLVDYSIPKEYISFWLAGRHRNTIFASAGLGFLASSCSHGCLALSIELYRKGASIPAVLTFLLASPWASLSLTLLIVSLMGGKGFLIVLMCLVVAINTGIIFQGLERRKILAPNPNTVIQKGGFSIWADLLDRFRRRAWNLSDFVKDLRGVLRGAWALGQMVLLWVAIGFTLSAVLGTMIPHGWWSGSMGPTVPGLLVTMLLAAVIEVCSEGTAPLAVELYRQTGALGNAFAFLMGGVVTDFTELSVLWANLGKKVVFWLMLVTLPQVFLIGVIMNWMKW